jgi:hypothetical protein
LKNEWEQDVFYKLKNYNINFALNHGGGATGRFQYYLLKINHREYRESIVSETSGGSTTDFPVFYPINNGFLVFKFTLLEEDFMTTYECFPPFTNLRKRHLFR